MRPPQPISEKQKESLQELLKKTKAKGDYQRVLCLWLRAGLGLSSSEVATAVGFSASTVRQVQARYFQRGESALLGPGRGGRRHQNLSEGEERELLERFEAKARSGGVLVVNEIQAAYEEAVEHRVPKSTVYRMLARHGWRKIAPRPNPRRRPG